MLISVTTPSYQWSEYLDFGKKCVLVVVVLSGNGKAHFLTLKWIEVVAHTIKLLSS